MPSLFKKLFRRKGEKGSAGPGSAEESKAKSKSKSATSPSKSSKSSSSKRNVASPSARKSNKTTPSPANNNNNNNNNNHNKAKKHQQLSERSTNALGPRDEDEGRHNRSPSLSNTVTTSSGPPSSTTTTTSSSKPSLTKTTTATTKAASHRVLSPRNNPASPAPTSVSLRQMRERSKRSPGPVDLDDFEESDENRNEQILSKKSLEQFNLQQQQHQQPHSPPLYVTNDPPKTLMDQSESSASLNLSTDAEDEEYNQMRRRYDATGSALDSSNISSPVNDLDDDHQDSTIFPALQDANPAEDTPSSSKWSNEDDMRAWGLSPPSQGSTKENAGGRDKKSQSFQDFNFANFDNAFPDANAFAPRTKSEGKIVFDTDDIIGKPSKRRPNSSSASAAVVDTSLSELLAQAKRASSSGKSRGKPSPSSVNSAPAITASYLRQYHGLRGENTSDKTTSVSDIIQSLEATNAARLKSSSKARSVSSRESGANASVRSAKERIRERRRRQLEQESSEDDQDPSESWLFDEVTGALGPRGAAADMESLSGRSNNSKRSHKSHRSHRSHRSSRRRHKSSSNESVDSRNSRYSHRSTRSYLSHMSQESRSVANDLLRLEMQLAMVGSSTDAPAPEKEGSVSGSIGTASRTSRSSRRTTHSIAKRTKISVVAPPGKLGIILANKADSKGTVVSGVRTSSALAEKISPGDRIIAIDGEDCSRMTVSEITTIMARKSDFERILTVLTTPKREERRR